MPGNVLVTGASTGIGEACVLCLHREGWRVFAGVRKAEDGDRLRAATSHRLTWLPLDVTDPAQIEGAARAFDSAGTEGLSGLVNNAGIAVGGPLEYLPPEALRRQLDVNVVGLHAVTKAFLPAIRRARGRVVHVGSIAGRIASPLTGAYAASKHAVEALADVLRQELAPDGILVSVVEPGQIATPIWDKGLEEFTTVADRVGPEGMARYGSRLQVLRHILERAPARSTPPESVAEAVLHALTAARPRLRYVVGRDARLRLFLKRLLPERLHDALVLSFLKRLERRFA